MSRSEEERREITAAQGAFMVAAGVMDPADLREHDCLAFPETFRRGVRCHLCQKPINPEDLRP